jgi:DNA-binding NarL/FixJ family response regulator
VSVESVPRWLADARATSEDSAWERPLGLLMEPAARRMRSGDELVLVAGLRVGACAGRGGHELHELRNGGRTYLMAIAPPIPETLERLLQEQQPRLLLIDVKLCAELGMPALRHLRRACVTTDWLLGWDEPSPRWIETVIQTQARGAVQWSIDACGLTHALESLLAGEMWFSRCVMQWLYASMLNGARAVSAQSSPARIRLTQREAEALALMRQGLTNQQIANGLGVSVNTVKKHLGSAFEKLGLRGRRQVPV